VDPLAHGSDAAPGGVAASGGTTPAGTASEITLWNDPTVKVLQHGNARSVARTRQDVLGRVAAHEDDANVGPLFPHCGEHLLTRQLGQVHIQQDEIEGVRGRPEHRQSLLSVCDQLDAETYAFTHAGHELSHCPLVIHREHMYRNGFPVQPGGASNGHGRLAREGAQPLSEIEIGDRVSSRFDVHLDRDLAFPLRRHRPEL